MYGEGRIVGVIEIFKRGFSFIGYVMTGAFLFCKALHLYNLHDVD